MDGTPLPPTGKRDCYVGSFGFAKVAGLVAGTALMGGGAVHVAEKASSNKPQYVKHAKAPVRKAAVRTQVVTKQVAPSRPAAPAPPPRPRWCRAAAGPAAR
jgi:hypothetical protein